MTYVIAYGIPVVIIIGGALFLLLYWDPRHDDSPAYPPTPPTARRPAVPGDPARPTWAQVQIAAQIPNVWQPTHLPEPELEPGRDGWREPFHLWESDTFVNGIPVIKD